MISTDLANLSDMLVGASLNGEGLPPRTCAILAQAMLDLSAQIAHLENVPLRLDSPEVRLGFHKLRESHDAD
jgi:hypothetical protein